MINPSSRCKIKENITGTKKAIHYVIYEKIKKIAVILFVKSY